MTDRDPPGVVQVGWIAPHVLDYPDHWRSFHRDHDCPLPSSQDWYDKAHASCLPVFVPAEAPKRVGHMVNICGCDES